MAETFSVKQVTNTDWQWINVHAGSLKPKRGGAQDVLKEGNICTKVTMWANEGHVDVQ